MKRFFSLFGIALLIFTGYGLGRLWPVLRRPPIVLHQDATYEAIQPQSRWIQEQGGYLIHEAEEAHSLLIFYPGGLVVPQAYEWWATALAEQGVSTVIPRFPFDLAVTAPNRALSILDALETDAQRIIIAGHSLGGAMAARLARQHEERFDGLILMAAYPAEDDDLSQTKLSVLVMAAEHDGLATLSEMQEGLQRLPETTNLSIIDGAVHSFFGRYGPQDGDGQATVSRHQAEQEMLRVVLSFIESFEMFIVSHP